MVVSKRFWSVVLFQALISSPSIAAEFWVDSGLLGEERIGQIILVGDIEAGDAEILEQMLQDGASKGILVWGIKLFSRGGSVEEGIAIGRLIRKNRLVTTAPNQGMVSFLKDQDWGNCYTVDFF